MKWVFLAAALLSVLPLSLWLRRRPARLWIFCFLIGFLPFVTDFLHLYMAAVSWSGWGGYAKGFEITLLDIVAAVVVLSIREWNWKIPFLAPMAFYVLVALIASANAIYPTASMFYVWQLLRMILVYVAVFMAVSSNPNALQNVFLGLACGELLELAATCWQRFGSGVLQTAGTMEHQNQLGLASHFVTIPFFAILLGGRRGWLPAIVVIAGLIVESLTTSRGTIILGIAGLGLTYLVSAASRWTSRKAQVALIGMAILAVALPFAITNLQQRYSGSVGGPELTEDSERVSFKKAASMIIEDYPRGVGPNFFTVTANLGGYYERAGVAHNFINRQGTVHNVYILVLAETGILGLLGYIGFILFPLVAGMRNWFNRDTSTRHDILIGLSVALIVVYIHAWEEWVLIQYVLQYFLVINFGVIAALASKYRAARSSAAFEHLASGLHQLQ